MPIIKSKVRVLRPDEYAALADASLAPGWDGCRVGDGRVLLDTALHTGMRYVELQRFQWHGSRWFDGKFVFLPQEAIQKHERRQLERWVKLSTKGIETVAAFLRCSTMFPSWWAWTDALRRWAKNIGLDPQGLGPKTTRKTKESWLMATYPEHWMEIVLSQGHTAKTSLSHYLNMPFLPEDKERMRPYLAGYF